MPDNAIPPHHILCAGFPCQPFSIAGVSKKLSLGKKHGFEDKEQGNLFFKLAVPDVFSKSKRSEVMSRIRSRGNKDTELALIRVFRECGISGWRRHVPIRISEERTRNPRAAKSSIRAPRSAVRIFLVCPDFVFRQVRLALFVDGCFWHACPVHATKPKGNAAFWRKKLAANQERDRRVNRELKRAGWRVLRIWEHELTKGNSTRLARRLTASISGGKALRSWCSFAAESFRYGLDGWR